MSDLSEKYKTLSTRTAALFPGSSAAFPKSFQELVDIVSQQAAYNLICGRSICTLRNDLVDSFEVSHSKSAVLGPLEHGVMYSVAFLMELLACMHGNGGPALIGRLLEEDHNFTFAQFSVLISWRTLIASMYAHAEHTYINTSSGKEQLQQHAKNMIESFSELIVNNDDLAHACEQLDNIMGDRSGDIDSLIDAMHAIHRTIEMKDAIVYLSARKAQQYLHNRPQSYFLPKLQSNNVLEEVEDLPAPTDNMKSSSIIDLSD